MTYRKIPDLAVNVSKPIIAKADGLMGGTCMIAIALREHGVSSIKVGVERIRFNLNGWRYDYQFPQWVYERQRLFDALSERGIRGEERALKVKAFKFRMDGRSATCAPVVLKGPNSKPATKHDSPTRNERGRRCKRRYHAIAAAEGVAS